MAGNMEHVIYFIFFNKLIRENVSTLTKTEQM